MVKKGVSCEDGKEIRGWEKRKTVCLVL